MNITKELQKWALDQMSDSPAELNQVKWLNTLSFSGFNATIPYAGLLEGDYSKNAWTLQTVNALKMWNFAKWDYKNVPEEISLELMEGMLFLWGRVAWGKKGEEYFLYHFSVKQKDHYGLAEIVDLRSIGSGKVMHVNQKVGKDCFIIYNDTSYWLPNIKIMYGPLWRVFGLLIDHRMIYETIINKSRIARTMFAVDVGTKDTELIKFDKMLQSNTRFLPILDGSFPSSGISQRAGSGANFVELNLDHATEELWNTYHNVEEEIKAKLGMVGNINPKKKERQVGMEIEVSNTLPNYILEAELKNRKIGFDKINEIFGLDIQVELKQIEEAEMPEKEEENGKSE